MSRLYTAVPVHKGDRWLLTLFDHSFAQAPEVHECTFRTTAVQSYTHPPKNKNSIRYAVQLGPRWPYDQGKNLILLWNILLHVQGRNSWLSGKRHRFPPS